MNTMSDEVVLARFDVLFSPTMRQAHNALLNWAEKMEPDGWPTIPTILRFARFYRVPSSELAALCGVPSYRLGNRTVYCDATRCPGHVRMTPPGCFSRRVLAAYGYYVTAAELAARDRVALH